MNVAVWRRLGARFPLIVVFAVLVVAVPTVAAHTATPIAFGKSPLAGEASEFPTTLQFGPDGRLYVGQFDGHIKVHDVVRYGPNTYAVTATQTITSIRTSRTMTTTARRTPPSRPPRDRHPGRAPRRTP